MVELYLFQKFSKQNQKKFYIEIIPLLKGRGVTIIAITHDDKYYHCADKLFKMEYGKLMDQSESIKKVINA